MNDDITNPTNISDAEVEEDMTTTMVAFESGADVRRHHGCSSNLVTPTGEVESVVALVGQTIQQQLDHVQQEHDVAEMTLTLPGEKKTQQADIDKLKHLKSSTPQERDSPHSPRA